jgi:hypothetical protein
MVVNMQQRREVSVDSSQFQETQKQRLAKHKLSKEQLFPRENIRGKTGKWRLKPDNKFKPKKLKKAKKPAKKILKKTPPQTQILIRETQKKLIPVTKTKNQQVSPNL